MPDWVRRQRPENEVPGSVVLDEVLAGDGETAVFMTTARAYSTGVELSLEVRARHVTADGGGDLMGAVHGHGGSDDRLLLGIEFSDGRRCTNLGNPFTSGGADSTDQPVFMPGGGSGGARSSDLTLFLSPLPPPGELRVVCLWPTRGLPETITVLVADNILAAAQRVRVLWPWEPEPEPQPPLPPPGVPDGSWFAQR
jgi:hypothetical protein